MGKISKYDSMVIENLEKKKQKKMESKDKM